MPSFPKLCLTLALCGFAAPALACPGGTETVLSCTAKGGQKALQVCIQGDYVTYSYGPRRGAPELQLAEAIRAVDHQPWPGVGRTIWEATTFRNGGYAYEAWIAVDRRPAGDPPAGGVTVMQGSKTIANVDCDVGTAEVGVWAVSDAKEARGICWDASSFRWARCN